MMRRWRMNGRSDRREFVGRAELAGVALPWLVRTQAARALASRPPKKDFRGIFPILQTPFDQNDQIHLADLDREVNYGKRAGTQGLVWPQLASEFYLLSEEERMRGAEIIIRA